jgi:hypothetical protein
MIFLLSCFLGVPFCSVFFFLKSFISFVVMEWVIQQEKKERLSWVSLDSFSFEIPSSRRFIIGHIATMDWDDLQAPGSGVSRERITKSISTAGVKPRCYTEHSTPNTT